MLRFAKSKTISVLTITVLGTFVTGLFSPVFAQNGTGTADEWAELLIILWSILIGIVILIALVIWFGIAMTKDKRKG